MELQLATVTRVERKPRSCEMARDVWAKLFCDKLIHFRVLKVSTGASCGVLVSERVSTYLTKLVSFCCDKQLW